MTIINPEAGESQQIKVSNKNELITIIQGKDIVVMTLIDLIELNTRGSFPIFYARKRQ